MKIAIWGMGSIGKKHFNLLREMNCQTKVISRRSSIGDYQTINECLKMFSPDLVWICNETHLHYESLLELENSSFFGYVLVEKPLFHEKIDYAPKHFKGLYVTYNMRFHTLLLALKKRIAGEDLLSVNIYVGQYLPTWRPDTDYRESYSAKKSKGGGALRDLSHELDYAIWLFGKPDRLVSLGGKFSKLDISSDEIFSMIYNSEDCPLVNITMNYYDRICQRFMIVNTSDHTYKIDFVLNTLSVDRNQESLKGVMKDTYLRQAESVVNQDFSNFCRFEEALEIQQCIKRCERSSEKFLSGDL